MTYASERLDAQRMAPVDDSAEDFFQIEIQNGITKENDKLLIKINMFFSEVNGMPRPQPLFLLNEGTLKLGIILNDIVLDLFPEVTDDKNKFSNTNLRLSLPFKIPN